MSVFDVCAVIADPRVEYVFQRVLSKKEIAQDSKHAPEFFVSPQSSQVGYRIYRFLLIADHTKKFTISKAILLDQLLYFFLVFLQEIYDAFAEIFRNVFGLIFEIL